MQFDRFYNTDLYMCQCGTENCDPGHDYGPAVRDHFLIHYVLDGKGTFHVGNKSYTLGKGQGFLICPDVITYYKADFEYPWAYCWVGFSGIKAESYLKSAGLEQETPIFTYDRDDSLKLCLLDMVKAAKVIMGGDVRLLGLLYLFLSLLIETSGNELSGDDTAEKKRLYVRKAVEYIEMNYSRAVKVSGIADYIGLDRSYMGMLFKERMNATPQEYLMTYRIGKACELMKNNSLSIGDIARSVGYEDQLLFSKVFKKVKNISPREFRKLI